MSRIAIFAVLVGSLLSLPHTAAAQRRDRDDRRDDRDSRIDTTFSIPRTGTVEISTSSDVRVNAWDREEVRVVGQSEGGQIRVRTGESRVEIGGGDFGGMLEDASIDLTVPKGARLVFSGGSGDIDVRNTEGDIEIERLSSDISLSGVASVSVELLSGDLTIRRADAISARLTSGELTASEIERDVEINMVSGDLLLSDINSQYVRVTVSGGDITYRGNIKQGARYMFTSHAGDVTLRVPANTKGSFSVESFNGEVESDFPITLKAGSSMGMPRKLDFDLGGGGARVSVRSFSGEIHLVRDSTDNRKEN